MEKTTPPSEVFPAPVLPAGQNDKWRREQRAFHRLLPDLLAEHRGEFVAIHEERVVESGADKLEVARKAYERFGYVPIFVSLVSDQTLAPARLPSPRQVRPEAK